MPVVINPVVAGPTSLAGSFNGLSFGLGNEVHIADIEGLEDLPAIRDFDELRSGDHGAWMGNDLLATREVTITYHLIPEWSTYEQLRDQFKSAMITTAAELPLYLYGSTRLVNCRVRRRSIPVICDQIQRYATAVVQFIATDPRVYDETETVLSTGLATAAGGITFPVTFPVSFGAASSGGYISATNYGNTATRPVAVITGPVVNPRIENQTTGQTVSFAITLGASETLTVDFDAHSVLLNGTASRRSTLVPGSRWWELNPGTSEIRYQADGYTASTLDFAFRSAWL